MKLEFVRGCAEASAERSGNTKPSKKDDELRWGKIRQTDKPWTESKPDWLIIPVIESGTIAGLVGKLDQAWADHHPAEEIVT